LQPATEIVGREHLLHDQLVDRRLHLLVAVGQAGSEAVLDLSAIHVVDWGVGCGVQDRNGFGLG